MNKTKQKLNVEKQMIYEVMLTVDSALTAFAEMVLDCFCCEGKP